MANAPDWPKLSGRGSQVFGSHELLLNLLLCFQVRVQAQFLCAPLCGQIPASERASIRPVLIVSHTPLRLRGQSFCSPGRCPDQRRPGRGIIPAPEQPPWPHAAVHGYLDRKSTVGWECRSQPVVRTLSRSGTEQSIEAILRTLASDPEWSKPWTWRPSTEQGLASTMTGGL